MKLLSNFPAALLLSVVFLPACAQHPQPATTPRPETPFSTKPSPQEQISAAERQFKVMEEVHQRLMNARTPQERRGLMAEHSRAMRNAMAAMEAMHQGGMGSGHGMAGHHLQQQLTMMQMMMRMMMDRIDMLSETAK